MFSFFFERLYHIQDIQQAFKSICLDKMLSEGYFDMSLYIYGRIKKEDVRGRLAAFQICSSIRWRVSNGRYCI